MFLALPAALVSAASTLRPGRGTRRPPHPKGRLFLHVGSHKTGTTSIQEALHSHARELAARKVLYPNAAWSFGGDPARSSKAAHFGFAAALADSTGRSLPRLEAFRDRLAEALGRAGAVVLSAESMYRHVLLPPGLGPRASDAELRAGRVAYVRRLAEFLDGFDPEVIVYFRRPDSFAESVYREAAVTGWATLPFSSFLRSNLYRYDYGFQLDLLREHFPVHAFGFEVAASEGLVAHFLRTIGLKDPPDVAEVSLRTSIPKRAAQWLVRHNPARPSGLAGRQEQARRWLFALQAGHRPLFEAPPGAGFWSDEKERDAFVRRALAGFEAVTFPPPPPVVPLPDWTDGDDARTEEAFRRWSARHRARLLLRELRFVPPYRSSQLD